MANNHTLDTEPRRTVEMGRDDLLYLSNSHFITRPMQGTCGNLSELYLEARFRDS